MTIGPILILESCMKQEGVFSAKHVKVNLEVVPAPSDKNQAHSVAIEEVRLVARKEGQKKSFVLGKNVRVSYRDSEDLRLPFQISSLILDGGLDVQDIRFKLRLGSDPTSAKGVACQAFWGEGISVDFKERIFLEPGYDYTLLIEYAPSHDCPGLFTFSLKPLLRKEPKQELAENFEDDYESLAERKVISSDELPEEIILSP